MKHFAATSAITMSALIGLAACGHTGSDSPTPAQVDLRAEAMNSRPLAADQKARLSQIFKTDATITPSIDLYFGKTSSSSQSDLDKLNDEGKSYLAKVRANCLIDPGAAQGDGSSAAKVTTRTISGKDCPISYTEKNSERSDAKYDEASKTFTGSSHSETNSSQKITDPVMRRRVFVADTQTTGSNDVVYNQVKADNGKVTAGSITSQGASSISGLTFDNRPLTAKVKTLSLSTPATSKIQVLFTIQTPDGDNLVIGSFVENGKQEILLNGESYTPERLKEELGIDMNMKSN
jgi:hypothetical protein